MSVNLDSTLGRVLSVVGPVDSGRLNDNLKRATFILNLTDLTSTSSDEISNVCYIAYGDISQNSQSQKLTTDDTSLKAGQQTQITKNLRKNATPDQFYKEHMELQNWFPKSDNRRSTLDMN